MAIFLITAPSGAGKTTMVRFLQGQGFWNECISTTTRPMREGEEDGSTYYFISADDFQKIDFTDGFVEKVKYKNHYYGITKEEIERLENKGSHISIIVEYEGYKQLKGIYPDSIGIFLYMSKEECMANMLLRGDSLENAIERISTYDAEMSNRNAYDYVIRNVRGKMNQTANIMTYITKQY